MYNVLLVDDEKRFFDILLDINSDEYIFNYAKNSQEADDFLQKSKVDLILMDWNLSEEDGLEIVKKMKKKYSTLKIPVIMLTGKMLTENMVEALDSGADDYVVKPFDLNLLTSKIAANLRKYGLNNQHKQSFVKNIHFDQNTLTITFKGESFKLTDKEFKMLETMALNPDTVYSRKEINNITNGSVFVSDRTVDTFVSYIRKKMKGIPLVSTIPKQGYKINSSLLE